MRAKMKGSSPAVVLLLLGLVTGLSLAASYQEDDLVFDDVGDESASPTSSQAEQLEERQHAKEPKKWLRVEKLLGMPDIAATVGKVFKLHVPKQAFSGNVDYYEARGVNNRGLPHWLRWDEPASALYGVPSRRDVGRHRVTIRAVGSRGDSAQDSFYIHVVPTKNDHFSHKDGKKRCSDDQDRTLLTIMLDAQYDSLKPQAKVNAIENVAGFYGVPTNSLTILPDAGKDSPVPSRGSSIVLSGPGSSKRREKYSTAVQWQVGCDGHFWPHQIDTIKQIPEHARDGTLAEVMELPVYQWRVRNEAADATRSRRQAGAGSGDDVLPDGDGNEYDDENEDEYDDEDADYNEGVTAAPRTEKPITQSGVEPKLVIDEHPHRHHHGDENIAAIGSGLNHEDDFIWRGPEINNSLFDKTNTTSSASVTTNIENELPSSTTTTTTTTTSTSTTTTTTTTTTETPIIMTTTTESPAPSEASTSDTTMSTESPTPPIIMETSSNSNIIDEEKVDEDEIAEVDVDEEIDEEIEIPDMTIESSTSSSATTNTSTETFSKVTKNEFVPSETPSINNNENQVFTGPTVPLSQNNSIDLSVNLIDDNDYQNVTETETLPESTTTDQESTSSVPVSSVEFTYGPTSVTNSTSNVSEEDISTTISVQFTPVENTEKTKDSSGSPSTSVTVSMSSENPTEKTVQSSQIPIDNYNISAFDSLSTPQPTLSTSTSTVALMTSTKEPSTTSITTTTTEATTTTTSTTMPEPSTPSSTTTTTTTTTTEEPPTTSTSPSTTTTTTTSTTTTLRTTESFYPRIRNMAPKVERRLKKIPITQGKSLSYTIPEDTFSDPEDGNTRKLSLRVTEKGAPLKPSHWLQFNERTQEIYGLPLEEHYGTYLFEVEASDSEGLTASDKLDISVQQHKQTRAINHEFTLYLKIVKRSDFLKNVDWQLEVMRNLAQLYGDKDLSYITVRAIDINNDQAIYTWTNDSLIRTSDCPHEEINKLHQMLISKENSEEPSDNLISVLGPKIIPKRVEYQGLEQCQKTKETKFNEYPVPRNQIDRLNATAGQLFVYRVPKDTFFDEEDGDTRSMKATLLTASRTEIPSSDWLQFDSSNQEFYGVPMDQDVGQKTYQLVVKDSEGLEATDSLVAEVHSAPFYRHPLQISMVLNMPRNDFAHSALKKRIFVEKLQKVYGDRDTSAISLVEMHGNNDGTTISWRNITLPTYECPHDEIARLTNVIATDHNGEKNFTAAFKREFQNGQQPDFIVSQVTFKLRGVCEKQIYGSPEKPPIDDSRSVGAKHDDLYITYVLPAVIIGSMFALAGIIACILYKRKRSGKMSISEKDEERQSFRSRGIPVIFQDELDEKPDPGNKSPIILKEEKPPLPPPEYQRAEDGADIPMLSKENSEEPYQPPPPFATNRDSNRLNRPKPTPTYRKPPPYVPP
ncbi:hypothetical protein TKK_0019638 [Trichogramma kaykai]